MTFLMLFLLFIAEPLSLYFSLAIFQSLAQVPVRLIVGCYWFSAAEHVHETDPEGGARLGGRNASHVAGDRQNGRRGALDVLVYHSRILKSQGSLPGLRRLQNFIGHRYYNCLGHICSTRSRSQSVTNVQHRT